MTNLQRDEALRMFFDEDFSPVNYVDAVHESLAGHNERYSASTLSTINAKTQDLVAHLDYNTNEILRELTTKVKELQRVSNPVGSLELTLAEVKPSNTGTNRLHYYVDALRNSVETLKGEVDLVREKMGTDPAAENGPRGPGDPIDTLIQLKTVRINILRVCDVLQRAGDLIGSSAQAAVPVENFESTLMLLQKSLKAKHRDGSKEEADSVMDTVEELSSYSALFQPFTQFGPIYSLFLTRLKNDLQ